MLSILPYDRGTERDADRPFKSYPRVPVSVPSSNIYGYGSAAFVGRQSHRGALDLSGMDLRHGMHMGEGPHLGDMSQGHRDQMPSHMAMKPEMDMRSMYQHQMNPEHYLGRAGQPAPLPPHHEPPALPPTPQDQQPPPSHSPSSPESSLDSNSIKIPPKKRPLTVPEDLKDNSYWEKRKKNNESAKRSRDARRMKEEQIAMRVVYLEQENLQLRTEVSLLKSEIEKLRCMLYNS